MKKVLKSFPHKDDMIPRFASKRDHKDVREHRISHADIYNTDKHLLGHISMTLHAFIELHTGVPYPFTENNHRDVDDADKEYVAHLTALRDTFIWLYEHGENPEDLHSQTAQEEYQRVLKQAFHDLAESLPYMWT